MRCKFCETPVEDEYQQCCGEKEKADKIARLEGQAKKSDALLGEWQVMGDRLQARVAELEGALREAGKPIETQPQVGRSIDYANGFRVGAQCQRLHAQSVAKQTLKGERDD